MLLFRSISFPTGFKFQACRGEFYNDLTCKNSTIKILGGQYGLSSCGVYCCPRRDEDCLLSMPEEHLQVSETYHIKAKSFIGKGVLIKMVLIQIKSGTVHPVCCGMRNIITNPIPKFSGGIRACMSDYILENYAVITYPFPNFNSSPVVKGTQAGFLWRRLTVTHDIHYLRQCKWMVYHGIRVII